MDTQLIVNLGLGVLNAVLIPALTLLLARIKDAEKNANEAKDFLQAYKTYVAENYISVRRFEGFENAIFKKLDAISDKLDEKADKP